MLAGCGCAPLRGGMLSAAAGGDGAELSAARCALRSSWELAAVLNFLHVFRAQLAFADELRADELEDALLERGSTPPLLHELHLQLLQGMHPRSTFRSWRVTLADKLSNAWPDLAEGDCPFAAPAAEAEGVYDRLSAVDRVRVLRALCELRLDTPGDLRDFVDDDEPGDAVDFHGAQCLVGQDNRGARFYYQGLESGPRLYRERSRVGALTKRRLVRYRRDGDGSVTRSEEGFTEPGPVLLEGWELVASTGCVLTALRGSRPLTRGCSRREAVSALSEELRNDKFPGTRNAKLCARLDALAEEVTTRLKRDEARRARIARQRLEAANAKIEWDEGRPRRARQQVSYTMEEYDKQFAALLGRGRAAEPEPYAENPFVRRGRSAAALFADGAELAGGLPDTRRPRSGARQRRSDDESEEDSQGSAGKSGKASEND